MMLELALPFLSKVPFLFVIEAILVAIGVYYVFKKRSTPKKGKIFTEEEVDAIISAWEPEPLVPEVDQSHPVLHPKFADGKMTKNVSIEGKEYLNFATSNFLSFIGEKRIEEVAKKTIFKYGVGSCGPRGFYGTVDVHLDLEAALAKFVGCEEAVLYSYGFATVASAIPAYAKKGDVIFVDRGSNFAIQKGCQASRARVEWFNHNDIDDLERLLIEQQKLDRKNPRKAASTRRFIVVEGLYANTADLCPLPQLIDLKWKYKVRIFIDESYSFGVLGKTGRGITEHYGVPMAEVDMVMASLENAIASTGGFCVGRSYVVSHQRLSGLGYCFSASLPPLLATAANEALTMVEEQPERIAAVRKLATDAYNKLAQALKNTRFFIGGIPESPMKHIYYDGEKGEADQKLDQLVDKLFEEHSIMLTRARYLEKEELNCPRPSIRFMVQYALTDEELSSTIETLGSIASSL